MTKARDEIEEPRDDERTAAQEAAGDASEAPETEEDTVEEDALTAARSEAGQGPAPERLPYIPE